MQAGWSTSWNEDCQEKYQSSYIRRWHYPYGRKQRWTKEPLNESERGEWKSWLKTQHSKNEDHSIWSHHFMTNRWENNANSDRLYFLGLQNHCRWWLQPWNSKTLTPWKKSYDKPRHILKSQDIILPTKVRLVKIVVFPIVMYGCTWLYFLVLPNHRKLWF